MKKVVLSLITVVMAAGSTFAQQIDWTTTTKESVISAVKKSDELVKKATPTKPGVWLDRAKAYLTFAAYPDSTLGNTDLEAAFKGVEYLNEAIKMAKETGKGGIVKDAEKLLEGRGQIGFEAFWNVGVNKFNSRDYANSYRFLDKASQLAPKDTLSALYAGYAASIIQKDSEAKVLLTKYLASGGKEMLVFLSLSQIYRNLKDEDNALKILEDGMKIHPTSKDLQNEKYNLYITFNKLDAAMDQLKLTIEKDPKDVLSIYNLGYLYEVKMSNSFDELQKVKDTYNTLVNFNTKYASQKDKVDVYTSEVNNVKDKLKKAKIASQKAQYQAQIARITESIDKEKKELTLLEEEFNEVKKKSGSEVELKAKIESLNASIESLRSFPISNYKRILEINPQYFDALNRLGIVFKEEGDIINQTINNMDIATYNKEGKALEAKSAAKYKEALPFLEGAYSVKKDKEVRDRLEQVYRALKIDKQLD